MEIVPINLDRVLQTVGSSTYDTWVSRLTAGELTAWYPDGSTDPEPFELYYADSAAEMESSPSSRDPAGTSARMSAGMCWGWTDETGTFPDVSPDPNWARPWNAGDRHSAQGIPRRKRWATDPGGFGQIGCVHTAQGLEYEWGGVIMGPDLTWEDGAWVAHREHVKSKASRIKDDNELTQALCRAYGVLITRSIRSLVFYSVDPAARKLSPTSECRNSAPPYPACRAGGSPWVLGSGRVMQTRSHQTHCSVDEFTGTSDTRSTRRTATRAHPAAAPPRTPPATRATSRRGCRRAEGDRATSRRRDDSRRHPTHGGRRGSC